MFGIVLRHLEQRKAEHTALTGGGDLLQLLLRRPQRAPRRLGALVLPLHLGLELLAGGRRLLARALQLARHLLDLH